jgi:hypothetical protein
MEFLEMIISTIVGATFGLWHTITHPISGGVLNMFYFLIAVSLIIWVLEIVIPWRKEQKVIRRDFWLDTFYMFFNFYIYRVIFFAAFVKLVFIAFTSFLELFGYEGGHLIDLSGLAWGWQLLIFFIIADFAQWSSGSSIRSIIQ